MEFALYLRRAIRISFPDPDFGIRLTMRDGLNDVGFRAPLSQRVLGLDRGHQRS